jgi:hypothetical protein
MRASAAPSPQPHLRRRLGRLASRLPRREACERGACLLQMAPHDALPQPQHTLRDAPRCVPQQPWGQRPGAPLQPPAAVGDQGGAAARRAALGQAHPRSGVLGRRDAPVQALHGVGAWRLLARRPPTHALAAPRWRWARAVAPRHVRVDLGRHGDGAQPRPTLLGEDRGGGWGGRGGGGPARRALWACIQRVEGGAGARAPAACGTRSALGASVAPKPGASTRSRGAAGLGWAESGPPEAAWGATLAARGPLAASWQAPTSVSPVVRALWRTLALSGSAHGASAVWPATTGVGHGKPSGASPARALCTWGRAGRGSWRWPRWHSPAGLTSAAAVVVSPRPKRPGKASPRTPA